MRRSSGSSSRGRATSGWATIRGGTNRGRDHPCGAIASSSHAGPSDKSEQARVARWHHVQVLSNFAPGNYRFIVAVGRPFSSGIIADAGFDLVHAVFSRPLPLGHGLDVARRQVESAGRPATALAAFELRIPEPLSPDSFEAFNAPYVERMSALGLTSGGECVTARTNVAPTI